MKALSLTKPSRTVLEKMGAELRAKFNPLSGKLALIDDMERRLEAASEEHAKLSASEDLEDESIVTKLTQAERILKILPQKITEAYAELATILDESHNAANACLSPFDELVYEPLRQRAIAEIAKALLPFSRDAESAHRLAERADLLGNLLHWRQQLADSASAKREAQSIQQLLKAIAAALAGEELFSFAGEPAK